MLCHFTFLAETDIEEIGDYIAKDNSVRAVSFVQEIRARCHEICDAPKVSPIVHEELGIEIRRLVFGRYLIFYTLAEDRVVVLRVLHGARNLDTLL